MDKNFLPEFGYPTQKNELIPSNQKIEPYLISLIDHTSQVNQIVKILILFHNHEEKIEFITDLPEWTDQYNIFYDYQIIPALSLSFPLETLSFLVKNINTFIGVKQITQNHNILIDQSPISSGINEKVNDEQWNPSMSMDNWWLGAIGLENVPYSGKGVKLAIMDTGITVHPDFFTNGNPKDSRIIKSRNFTKEKNVQFTNCIIKQRPGDQPYCNV